MYLHLLFALKDPNMGRIEANFANLVYTCECIGLSIG